MNEKVEGRNSPFGTPAKPNPEDFISDFDEEGSDSDISNRYLNYFKKEFRLWRNLFDEKIQQASLNEGERDQIPSEEAVESWSRE